jgi:hypothetical protein
MTHILKRRYASFVALAFFYLGASARIYAAECDNNFTSSGNFLTGKTYKSFAELPRVTVDDAYKGAYQFVVKEGWAIQVADEKARSISALNSAAAKTGKSIPLNVSIEPAVNATRIAITYFTPTGTISPEDAVKDQFCQIIAAATVPATRNVTPKESGKARLLVGNGGSGQRSQESNSESGSNPMTTPMDGTDLCLAKACLGMTTEQASALNFEPAGTFKFSFSKGLGNDYGLDASGQRVWFSAGGDFDKKTIVQFAQKVHTVCATDFVSAKLKASDGQPIHLVFRPTIRNGKGVLVLTQIDRKLPGNMSASELKNFEEQAREKYGDAFVPDSSAGLKKPAVMSHFDTFMGRSLRLIMPFENIKEKLMEQQGCSEKVRLD